MSRDAAVDILRAGRGVGDRQARRLLTAGEGFWWVSDPDRNIRLASGVRVCEGLDVDYVGRPHLIPAVDFRGGPTRLRAVLAATVSRTDEKGSPLTRRAVAERTGVPASTQRRYENRERTARSLYAVYVHLSHTNPHAAARLAVRYRHWGVHRGQQGHLMRRHGDVRRAVGHLPGSGRAARRLNRKLARGTRPALQARGRPVPRAYFLAARQPSLSRRLGAWRLSKLALGRPAARPLVFDPLLDYSVVETQTRFGRRRFDCLVEPFWKEDII